jgi:hypothetical protein
MIIVFNNIVPANNIILASLGIFLLVISMFGISTSNTDYVKKFNPKKLFARKKEDPLECQENSLSNLTKIDKPEEIECAIIKDDKTNITLAILHVDSTTNNVVEGTQDKPEGEFSFIIFYGKRFLQSDLEKRC